MKKQLFSFLLLLSFVVSVSAQKAQVAATDGLETNLRKHIEYLASDKLEGRRTGEPGATAAADYIAKQFAGIGLKPGFRGSNGRSSFLQPFPYVTGVEMAKTGNEFALEFTQGDGKRIRKENQLTLISVGLDNRLQLKPVGFSPNGSVANAQVVFAGFGIVSPEQKFDDFEPPGGWS